MVCGCMLSVTGQVDLYPFVLPLEVCGQMWWCWWWMLLPMLSEELCSSLVHVYEVTLYPIC